MERDLLYHYHFLPFLHFNSHAHVERDEFWCFNRKYNHISTHTLTWSVTCIYAYWVVKICISTHTLTWSVTTDPNSGTRSYGYFNSHAHVERDALLSPRFSPEMSFQLTRSRGAWHGERVNKYQGVHISTHTLTWSVTIVIYKQLQPVQISTHTLTWSVTRIFSY